MKLNIYDIAKESGVSIATVSRVINNTGNVSDKTRKKVESVIKKVGYKPNEVARGLATRSTKTIGVMVPDIRNPFHSQAAFEIEQNLIKKGYTSILCNTTEEPKQKVLYFEMLFYKGIDGIILVGASYGDKEFEEVFEKIDSQIPIVTINNKIGDKSTFIMCDEKCGIMQSVSYLKSRGYKEPIYIGDEQKYETRACISKKNGFIEAMNKYYSNIKQPMCLKFKEDEEEYVNIVKLLKKNSNIDAIQFEKDTCAIKFLKVAEKSGIKIPEDVAIVGFDNIDVTNYSSKAISTIDHKTKKLCDIAIDQLMKRLNGEEVEKEILICPKFIAKETT